MIIYPAIDLIDSKCVRLTKGDYSTSRIYSENPIEVAKQFKDAGAEYLHVVDLYAAKSGNFTNYKTIEKLAEDSGLKVQVGGGIRSVTAAKRYLDNGVYRVVVGTAAVKNVDFLIEVSTTYPEKVCLALDCKNDEIMTDGWQSASGVDLFSFIDRIKNLPIAAIIVTDINKDGMLQGPSFELYERIKGAYSHGLIASGGITSPQDIIILKHMGVDGAIIGKALYEGKLDLSEILSL